MVFKYSWSWRNSSGPRPRSRSSTDKPRKTSAISIRSNSAWVCSGVKGTQFLNQQIKGIAFKVVDGVGHVGYLQVIDVSQLVAYSVSNSTRQGRPVNRSVRAMPSRRCQGVCVSMTGCYRKRSLRWGGSVHGYFLNVKKLSLCANQ